MSNLQTVERSSTQPDSPRRVEFTDAARQAIVDVCARDGDQAVLLAWPAGAAYLPRGDYRQQQFDVILGHIERCPIFVDARRLALFRDRSITLDVRATAKRRRHRTPFTLPDVPPSACGPAAAAWSLGEAGRVVQEELTAHYAGTYTPDQIAVCVRSALVDLNGSVSALALPEMVRRLADHRLRATQQSRDDDDRASR